MPSYITDWFPFTIAEVAVANEAMGVEPEQALADAEHLAEYLSETTENGMYGLTEIGGWLDPIAELSEDAARRVAAFREGRTEDPDWSP